jgi:hypothetical protein
MLFMAAKNEPVLVDVAAMGRKGGKARAANLSAEERSESARKAVQARWAAVKKKDGTKKVGSTSTKTRRKST